MTNTEIADKIYNSYFKYGDKGDVTSAKEHANALIDAQIEMMFQDEGNVIIEVDRDMYLDDWEDIRHIINKR